MSHDTDKLIRQLSLVAFLMAERRPLTARDVKGNVEGYSEMSDEAFARRFYSDRAELIQLGVPLHSQRDEFTGEELYTLKSDQYFLNELQLDDDELAALQTALFLLEGEFAYSEPLRLALQNLALGRPGAARHADARGRARRHARSRLLGRDVGPPDEARERDLEAADDQVPLLDDQPRPRGRAHGQPVRAPERARLVVPDRPSTWTSTRCARTASRGSAATSASRRGGSATSARRRTSRSPATAAAKRWQFGDLQGTAEIELDPDTAWWVERTIERGEIEDGVFRTEYADRRAARVVGAPPGRPGAASRAEGSSSTR